MRNMSFMLTTKQMYDCSKTVTRRLGWKFLKAGDLVMACEKCQGLGKGGKIVKIHPIEVLRVVTEPVYNIKFYREYRNGLIIHNPECGKEGFPELTDIEFIEMFCKEMKCHDTDLVNRIEFKHITKTGGN